MIYLKLLFSFIKIGLFSFGGGYAMIPLIQREIEMHGWISPSEFVDIIAISEMTPGPIAVNSATFVGYKTAGLFGSVVATIGVALPSLIIILLVSGFFFKLQNKPINIMIFYGIRPVITGLIAAAGVFVAETSIFKKHISIEDFNYLFNKPSSFFDFGGIVILVASLVALVRFKIHPILTIAGAGVAGIIIYSLIPLL
ncbi:MAG: chromate transporter [Clostridia bacterium]